MLAQLVGTAGVAAQDITVYDATGGRSIGAPIVDKVRANPSLRAVQFVVGMDRVGDGLTTASPDLNAAVHFAGPGMDPAYLPRTVTESKYLINLALFRAHFMLGVTLTAKNHFGSVYFKKSGTFSPSPLHGCGMKVNPEGSYNCLVELMGHKQLGGKTLLYMLDGLYPAKHNEGGVIRFASFGNQLGRERFRLAGPGGHRFRGASTFCATSLMWMARLPATWTTTCTKRPWPETLPREPSTIRMATARGSRAWASTSTGTTQPRRNTPAIWARVKASSWWRGRSYPQPERPVPPLGRV